MATLVAPLAVAGPAAAASCAPGTDFTVTPVHDPIFYLDDPDNLFANCVGYSITNDTGATVDDLWATVDNFRGGLVGPAASEDGVLPIGEVATGATEVASFSLATTTTSSSTTDHSWRRA